MRLSQIALVALFASTMPAMAQSEEVLASIENIHGDSDLFGEAFGALQDAFLFDDRTAFADLAFYPLAINGAEVSYEIETPEDLVENFDTILTPDIQAALASQDYADLIVTGEGVGFANGALWMTNVCLDEACAETQWGIVSINN
ncbi:MAG: hypothetical protein P0Y65_21235 [Candidatus Devosia phytovorans]|uniref:Uncharacterized protein n=1 Tax=Candidatus Devosia phytovorans TaxID=3121372 RepID=A0AAJ5VVJ5_9HYPH|nr:hypothetical protein [Devosia sp.]WEK04665.1 MAG: hypothetical protein P0Y65_21235 [Devosia sp.]